MKYLILRVRRVLAALTAEILRVLGVWAVLVAEILRVQGVRAGSKHRVQAVPAVQTSKILQVLKCTRSVELRSTAVYE